MALRVTQHHIEFAGDAEASDLRMTEQFVQVGVDGADYSTKFRMTEQFVQVGVSDADYSTKVRLTEQFVQVAVKNEGRATTAMLGTVDSILAGETIILGHPSGTLDLQYYPSPTSQVGRPDSVPGRTLMAGAPVNQPADIPVDYTGQLGTNISTFGAGLIWGYGANSGEGISQLTGRLGSINSSLGESLVPAYPSNAAAGGPSVYEESAQSILTLTSIGNKLNDVSVSASNSFSLTQAATSNIKMTPATTSLTLGVTARQNLRRAWAQNVLSITHSARQSIFELSASNSINIDGTWDQYADSGLLEQALDSTVSLTQEARTTLKSATAESTLALTQWTESNSVGLSAESTLSLTSESTGTGPLVPVFAESDLGATLDDDLTVYQSGYARNAGNLLSPVMTYAESSIKDVQAINGFTMQVSTRLADTFEESVEHTISLTQDVGISGSLRYFAETLLPLLSTVDNNVKTRHPATLIDLTVTADYDLAKRAESVLTMSVTATEGFVNLWAESQIELDHIVRPNPWRGNGLTQLEMDQWARSSIRMLEASSELELDQDINVQRPYYRSPSSAISGTEITFDPVTFEPIFTEYGLTQEATNQLASAHRYAVTTLSFAQYASASKVLAGAIAADAESTLTLTHSAVKSTTAHAYSQLEMDSYAEVVLGVEATTVWEPPTVYVEAWDYENNVVNEVEVVGQWAEFQINRAQAAQSIIPIKQAAAFQLLADTTKCYYTPFIGGSSDPNAPAPPDPVLPEQSFDPSVIRFRLITPTFGEIGVGGTPSDSITLRAPKLGNREGVSHTRVQRETSGRTLLVFRDPEWPKTYSMSLEWEGLKKDDALQLLRFISDNLGLEIGIQDHEGRCWKGTIANPDEAVTEDHNNSFSAMIQFEDVQRDPV